jgi:hypothetical protein
MALPNADQAAPEEFRSSLLRSTRATTSASQLAVRPALVELQSSGCYSAHMESAALEVGRLYAYRENPRAKNEMLKVKLTAKVGRGAR